MARARAADVVGVLTCGEDVASSERAIGLAEPRSGIAVAIGIHPHRAESCSRAALGRLRELARNPKVVAIGEIGLDHSGRSAPREAQAQALGAQLELALELGLPVVLHVRDAGAQVRELVDRVLGVRGQVHCFSEGPGEVDEWIARGLYLSFAGTLTFAKSERLRQAVRRVPADRLLFETDAPYLAPEPHRGRRNEPAWVVATVAVGARERGEAAAELAARSARNARDLFGPKLDVS